MESLSIPARRSRPALLGSRRLLALARDERLVEQIRRGNDAAFEVVFERYGGPILGFCRHLLGSREEAEDAVQHTFAAAHRQLLRDDRPIDLKPWLYTIARHRCLSMLRARRHETAPLAEQASEGLSEEVERRAELRELLGDVAELPFEQRAALLLAELGDLSHAQIAAVLECEEARVKALVYRARSGLIARRDARDLPCDQVREQLATLRGGALRRLELKHHLHACAGCRSYRDEVKRQRQLLGVALPVVPSLGLKSSVLGAIGFGGGSAGGGGGALALLSSLGGASAAKTAVAVVAATGAVVGGEVAVERIVESRDRPAAVSERGQGPVRTENAARGTDGARGEDGGGTVPQRMLEGRSRGRNRGGNGAGGSEGATGRSVRARGLAHAGNGKHLGAAKRLAAGEQALGKGGAGQGKVTSGVAPGKRPASAPGQAKAPQGRGPVDAPPATPPVARGPSSQAAPRAVQGGSGSQARPAPSADAPGQARVAPPKPGKLPAQP